MQHAMADTQNSKTTTNEEHTVDQLNTIYKSIGRQLWASFYAFCGNAERASDALQESFLKLQRQDLSTINDPRSWLRRVGRNWLRDVARRTKRSALIDAHLPDCTDSRENAALSLRYGISGRRRESRKRSERRLRPSTCDCAVRDIDFARSCCRCSPTLQSQHCDVVDKFQLC